MRKESLDLTQLVAVLPAHPHRRQMEPLDRPLRDPQVTRELPLGQPRFAIDIHACEQLTAREQTLSRSRTSTLSSACTLLTAR